MYNLSALYLLRFELNPELYSLFMPVSKVRGVGPKTVEAFKRLAISNIRDLLLHAPSSVIDRRKTPPLTQVEIDSVISQIVRVLRIVAPPSRSKAPIRVVCSNDSGELHLLYFNHKALPINIIAPENEIAVSGEVTSINRYDRTVEMSHPALIRPAAQFNEIAIIEPVYPSTYGTTSRYIHAAIGNALSLIPKLAEWIPDDILAKYQLPSWHEAVMALHQPAGEYDLTPLSPARKRLAFDEILAHEVRLKLIRMRRNRTPKPALSFSGSLKARLLASLPFALTDDQIQATSKLESMQASPQRMAVVLQGDVGAGKTIVATITMLNCIESGKKAVLMVPTELLAIQHHRNISALLEPMGIKVQLLISNLKAPQKREVLADLTNAEPMIAVGTHALFQDSVNIEELGLIIIDEQHRFGVEQRNRLLERSPTADFLMMTATPIPRTLAMTINGDLDVITIFNKPANRKEIVTSILSEAKLHSLIEGISRTIARNEKVYWVCPLIEESEALDLGHIEQRFEHLQSIFGEQVGVVHGRLPYAEREAIMAKFINGEVKILLATSVIEVGVDVKEATLIVVENSERFGLAQLHQLRGRVGRSDLQSYCVLLYKGRLSEKSAARLGALKSSNDGFYISQQDFKIRGAGDILGVKQSGLPDFRFFDYLNHELFLEDIDLISRQLAETTESPRAPVHNLIEIFQRR